MCSIQKIYGRELIQICQTYGLHFLNGRKDGDTRGNITCIANGGRSTVDYMIVNSAFYEKIENFTHSKDFGIRSTKIGHMEKNWWALTKN